METTSPIYIDLDFSKTESYKLQIDISQLATSKLVMEGKETKYFDKNGKEIFSIEEVNNKEKTLYYLSIPQKLFFQELLTEEHFNHINHVISTNYDMDFDPYSDSYTMVYKKKNTKSEQEELFMNKDISQSEITNSLDSLITILNKNRKVYFLVNNKVKKGKIKSVKIILTKTPTIIYEIYSKKKNTIYYINSKEVLYSTF